jgi:hypothetical protein
MKIQDNTKKKFLIYSTKTGNVLSDKMYSNTDYGLKKLDRDFNMLNNIKKDISIGEALVVDKNVIETIPSNLHFVDYR